MLPYQWEGIDFFKPEEFDSPDEPGSGMKMQFDFIRTLDFMRTRAQVPFNINSGYRTKAHNKAVGGETNSAHLRGWAADIACTDNHARYAIMDAAWYEGVKRVGVYPTWIHIDTDPTLPREVVWYGKGA